MTKAPMSPRPWDRWAHDSHSPLAQLSAADHASRKGTPLCMSVEETASFLRVGPPNASSPSLRMLGVRHSIPAWGGSCPTCSAGPFEKLSRQA